MRGMSSCMQNRVVGKRPQHETDSSLLDRNSNQQYHRACCACQMRERNMQVQARTGHAPLPFAYCNQFSKLIFGLSMHRQKKNESLHAVIDLRRIVPGGLCCCYFQRAIAGRRIMILSF